MRQIAYNVADLRISDHRPVFSSFDCQIDVVDHVLKDKLRREVYLRRQRDVLSDAVNLLDLDDEYSQDQDDGDYENPVAIAPGLPPASSDRNKWWLDNGELSALRMKLFPLSCLLLIFWFV